MNKFQKLTLLTAVSSVLAGVTPAPANDWPQWRGPNRDDLCAETGLLKDWPAGGPPLVWTATGLGKGFSTVSVVGDRIYTAGEKGDSGFLFALNTADGKPVWSTKFGKAADPGGFVGPRAAPTVEGDLLFALDQSGDLVCARTADGSEVWRKNLVKDFGGEQPNCRSWMVLKLS
jgi:outer membrane protein assembly factor BamB